MKRFVIILAAFILLQISAITFAHAQDDIIKLTIDSVPLITDINPVIIENRCFVPMRSIYEALGVNVEWDDKSKTIIASGENTQIILQIENTNAVIIKNSQRKQVKMETAPFIMNNKTFVPVRFVTEGLGCKVFWRPEKNTVAIITEPNSEHAIKPAQSYANNPLKGFLAFYGNEEETDFPHSMEYISLPLNAVQIGYNSFDWSVLEHQLDVLALRKEQACIRFYLDTPATKSGIPEFLIKDGLRTYKYSIHGNDRDKNNRSVCPDYSDKKLLKALVSFITAFGKKYDADPRIGYIMLGLYGFYGEWHCFGHNEWEADDSFMNALLDAYDAAFDITKLMVRVPLADSAKKNIGFHDDVFLEDTIPVELGGNESNFVQLLINAGADNKWQTEAIGGELGYNLYSKIFKENPWGEGIGHESFKDALITAHPTFLINGVIRQYTGTEKQNAIEAATKLGYDFRAKAAYYNKLIKTNSSLYLALDINNIGIAPFYYNWKVYIAAKQNDTVINKWLTDWDIRTITAEGMQGFEYLVPFHNLAEGKYTLSVMVENPLANGMPLKFANQGQNPDGWLDIGDFEVTE